MSAARLADGLLSAAQIFTLLEMVGKDSAGLTVDQAARDMGIHRAASHARTHNSIIMLVSAGILARQESRVVMAAAPADRWHQRIASWVAAKISQRMANGGAHALQLHDGLFILDPMQLPGPVDGLRLWLIEFGVASRSGSSSRRWIIDNKFESYFLNAARSWNRGTRRRVSQAELDERMGKQAEDGAEAEEWVLSRERARLASHPLVDQVLRTSIEDTGAGFDISSFSGCHTIVHDHFLEVKSFTGSRRFFWTRNEIAAAKRLGEAYQLYIVDRDRMDEQGYEPEVISGPYAALIETDDNGWSISPTTFECIAIDG